MQLRAQNNFARKRIGPGRAACVRGPIFSLDANCWLTAFALFITLTIGAQPTPEEPPLQTPVAEFRRWLAMSEAECAAAIAEKPVTRRRALEEKVKEYRLLPAEEREAKLMALEIRWYMRPLMELTTSNRMAQLARIPEPHRDIITQRLDQWDLLPEPARKELLENEWAMHYFVRLNPSHVAPKEQILARVRTADRKRFEQKLDHLRALDPQRRDELARSFEEFFTLSPEERRKTLRTLSDTERQEMEATLAAFEQLPLEQRRMCIDAFGKFARLSADERSQFLRNVERWQSMSAEDRQKWRSLVQALPPMPPGLGKLPPPPMPPGVSR